jgi:hypothetical protein
VGLARLAPQATLAPVLEVNGVMMRRFSLLTGVGLLAVVAAACGSASAPRVASIGTTTTPPKAAATAANGPVPGGVGKLGTDAMKFVACMRSHGVANFPDPVIGPGQVSIRVTPSVASSPHFKAAQAVCQRLLPGKPGTSPPGRYRPRTAIP